MKLWIFNEQSKEWEKDYPLLEALKICLLEDFYGMAFLISKSEPKQQTSLTSILEILKRFKPSMHVSVRVSYPTKKLIEELRECGADAIQVYDGTSDRFLDTDINDENGLTVSCPVCPALRMKNGNSVVLSVCGKRNDRLIPARKWRLSDYSECPNWKGTYDS